MLVSLMEELIILRSSHEIKRYVCGIWLFGELLINLN